MNRHIAVPSILAVALMLLAVPASAQRGGRTGFGGMRGGFAGFSSGQMGGFRGGFGGINRGFVGQGFVGRNVFNGGFNRFSFRNDRFFFDTRLSLARNSFLFSRRFFPRSSFFFGSFGSFGLWPTYSYWPGYSYGPVYGYSGYPYYPYYPQYYPAEPDISAYAGTSEGVPAENYWLIVLKDDTTLLVSDYWLDDSTLNYVTRDGKKLSVDLSKVNLDLTKKLNHERGLEFQLPRPSGEYQPKRRDSYGRVY